LDHDRAIETARHAEGDVLTLTMLQHGALLDRGFFALHMRAFPWSRFRMPVR